MILVLTACGKTIVDRINPIEDVFKNENNEPATIMVYNTDTVVFNIKIDPKSNRIIQHKSKSSTAPFLFSMTWDSIIIDFGSKKYTEIRYSNPRAYKSFDESPSYTKATANNSTTNTYIIDTTHFSLAK